MSRNKYPEETVERIITTARKLFTKQGYEATSIQDIIDHLGGLSKGAIYHHFKSKEAIFEAVLQEFGQENMAYYDQIRDDPGKNGRQKLQAMFRGAYHSPNNSIVIDVFTCKILSDPKYLANEVFEMYTLVAPDYIRPILEEGLRDGSILNPYPEELAELLITATNIWLNPLINPATPESAQRKLRLLNLLLHDTLGFDLFDDEMRRGYGTLYLHTAP